MLKAHVCVFKFSESTGPTEAKFHVAPSWDRGTDEKLIQMILVRDTNDWCIIKDQFYQ